MREDRLEHVAHLEVVRVPLVVEDVAAGDRGLVRCQISVFSRAAGRETVGVQLDDRRFADALEEVLPVAGWRRRPAG